MDNLWRKYSFGDVIKVRRCGTFPAVDWGLKIAVVETRKSKEIVPEAVEKRAQPLHLRKRRWQEGSATLINGEGAMGRGIKDKGQKGSDWGSDTHTRDQHRKSRKNAGSYDVISKRQFKVQIGRLSQLRFWVTVGIGPQCCITVRPSGHLFTDVFCMMKG